MPGQQTATTNAMLGSPWLHRSSMQTRASCPATHLPNPASRRWGRLATHLKIWLERQQYGGRLPSSSPVVGITAAVAHADQDDARQQRWWKQPAENPLGCWAASQLSACHSFPCRRSAGEQVSGTGGAFHAGTYYWAEMTAASSPR